MLYPMRIIGIPEIEKNVIQIWVYQNIGNITTITKGESAKRMIFCIKEKDGKEKSIDFQPVHIINAGYTGRDQAAVQAHIDELKEEGIPAPDKTPVYFIKFEERITQDNYFEVLDETDHSGEAEFALLFDKDEIYVGAGSDHTDRKLETIDIPKAKQIYPNTISRDLWKLSEVVGHWDDIIIRSWIKVDGVRTLFQEAALTAMLDANDIIDRVKKLLVDPEETQGLIIYSGTIASIFKAEYSPYFEVELEDPVLGRKLRNFYELKSLSSWYKGE
jgi:hypothetical protein